jgi:hypothetical protein
MWRGLVVRLGLENADLRDLACRGSVSGLGSIRLNHIVTPDLFETSA